MSNLNKNFIVPVSGYTKEQLNSTGIYCILNTVNQKMYVGSTAISFRNRWSKHKSKLNLNNHHSNYLQNSWIKYTEHNFQFIILEYVKPDQCLIREQVYLDSLNVCDSKFGYNTCITAGNQLGLRRSSATKAKISLAAIGRKHTLEQREAQSIRQTGMKQSAETIAKRAKTQTGRKQSPEHAAKSAKANLKKYIATDSEGNEHIVNHLKNFCIEKGLNSSSMGQVSCGALPHHKGWKCKRA